MGPNPPDPNPLILTASLGALIPQTLISLILTAFLCGSRMRLASEVTLLRLFWANQRVD